MNGHFDGGHGVYGAVLVGVVAELGSFLNRPGRKAGQSWKRTVLMLAVFVPPVAVLLANGNGL